METEKRVLKNSQPYRAGEGENSLYAEIKLGKDYQVLERLNESLSEVRGQTVAVQEVKEALFGIDRRENRSGVGGLITFIGPPGVGKTMVAEKIAQAKGRPFLRLDMSAYNDKEVGLFFLFGINKSYKESRAGLLTTFVEEHPVSVILLDEFEKAHPNVKNRFLQIFDRAEVQDLYTERYVSFHDSIIIVTMNLGKTLYDRRLTTYHLSDTPQQMIVHAIQSEIDPQTDAPYLSEALVSRFASGRIILFNKLRPEVLHEIAACETQNCKRYYREQYGVEFELEENAFADLLLYSLGESADARSVKKEVRDFFEKNLVRMTEAQRLENREGFTKIECKIDDSGATEEVREILHSPQKARVLVCCKWSQRETFLKHAKEQEEIVFAKKDLSFSALARMDLSMAIIDRASEEEMFSGKLFKALVDLALLPVYVYDLFAPSVFSLLYYFDHGAVDCRVERQGFGDWLSNIMRGVQLTAVAQRLFRANRVLSFDTQYSFKEGKAELRISKLSLVNARNVQVLEQFVSSREIPDVHFDDIFGAERAKKELKCVLHMLKNFKTYLRLGMRLPHGILLEGPPGVGKTMLAKAVAVEAGLSFLQCNAAIFAQPLVGKGAQNLRDIFSEARKCAPCIVFFDEIDVISQGRGRSTNEWHTDVLNSFLSEMDGFSDNSSDPVFVIASTNASCKRGDSPLDPAFLRRFDHRIHIDLPDLKIRRQYLTSQISKYPGDVSKRLIEGLSRRSVGWSLGELDNVVQNALRKAISEANIFLNDRLLNEAFEEYADGESKSCDEEKAKKTAVHEAGHACVASYLGVQPCYATINARGDYRGYIYLGEENLTELTREECLNRICIKMAGRAAEIVFYGEKGISTGARSDLKSATDLAENILCEFGMDDDFPVYVAPAKRDTPELSDKIIRIIKQQLKRAQELIEGHRAEIQRVASALIENTNLDETDLKKLIRG